MSGNILRMRYVLFKFKVFCLKKSYSGTKCIKRTHIEKDKDYQDDGLLLRKKFKYSFIYNNSRFVLK